MSIIPRGQALGVTMSAPDADVFNYEESYLRGKIKVALGGRVAEELAFGTITTGAESDIQQATQIARGMVGRWGMSDEIGFVAVQSSDGDGPLLPGVSETSEATQQLVDAEVRRIIEEAHGDVRNLLERERDKLDALAEALLRDETLDEVDAYAAAGIDRAGPRRRLTMEQLVATALAEDVGAGDLTVAAVVPADARARAVITQKEPGRDLGPGRRARGVPPGGPGRWPSSRWRPRASGARGERWRRSRAPPGRS